MFNPWVWTISWRRKWQPAPVFLPGKFHGLRNLVGYSPWGSQKVEHDWAHRHMHTSRVMKTVKPGWIIMSMEKGESLQVSWWSQVVVALGAFANSLCGLRVSVSLGSTGSDTWTNSKAWMVAEFLCTVLIQSSAELSLMTVKSLWCFMDEERKHSKGRKYVLPYVLGYPHKKTSEILKLPRTRCWRGELKISQEAD